MGRNKDGVQEFLDGIPDDKFCNWATKQYTIKEDYKLGMRLDHQGVSTSKEPRAGHGTDSKFDIDGQGWYPPYLYATLEGRRDS
jgi:hypothetical protein